ncbi:ankyrin [Rozella allomycis CSF55]|uniref:Ankyrin n=1 Tax=Rozella allomycis (strain CSF55) TaxID=988480 RepID=A0A075AWX1_ROZAC|nr:hypothetical protein O9G_001916 [Rozella allomycis CSF55]RKP21323.1 ankyrin [Rozella allomycis CSF55]|eukprot:EPZ34614.1 hypothetical protein O9G_001916 [Rozella allomycis CSF55]
MVQEFCDFVECARFNELEEMKAMYVNPIEAKDNRGNTALHMAAANGHIEIIKYLLELNSTKQFLDAQNDNLNTALHWATLNGHVDVVSRLLKAGASVLIKNDQEKTPFYEAENRGFAEIVSLMEEMVPENEAEEELQKLGI